MLFDLFSSENFFSNLVFMSFFLLAFLVIFGADVFAIIYRLSKKYQEFQKKPKVGEYYGYG